MSPDSMETRVGRLEQQEARHSQRLQDLVAEVHNIGAEVRLIASTNVAVARLESSVASLHADNANLKRDMDELARALDDRDQRASDERRAVRVAMISLTAVIAAALIAGIATIIAAGLG
jgi:chromosome segregation ATPase